MKTLIRLAVFLFLTGVAHAGCTVGSLPFVLQNGTVADADQVMANFNAIVSSVQAHCASAGVNSDITALSGLTSPIGPTLGGSTNFFGTGGGTGNAQSVVVIYPGTGWNLTAGYSITWTPTQANAGSATLSVGGTAAKLLVKQIGFGTSVLQGGELQPNYAVTATYTGTNYELRALPSQIATGGTAGITALQARTNLGAAASGSNSDITQLTGLTTPLSISQGGTGVASLPNGILVGNGTSPISSTSFPVTVSNGGTGQSGFANNVFLIGSGGPFNANPIGSLTPPIPASLGGTGQSSWPAGGSLLAGQGSTVGPVAVPLSVGLGGTNIVNPVGVLVFQGSVTPLQQNPLTVAYGGTGLNNPTGVIIGQGASTPITLDPLTVPHGGTGVSTIPVGFMIGQNTGNVATYVDPLVPSHGGTGLSTIPVGFMIGQNTGNVITYTDPLPIAHGGTGQSSLLPPVTRVYTSGSGTDSPSAGTQYQQLLFCGAGGGGAGTTSNGGPGGTTTVGGISANGGGGGNNTGGAGGTGGAGSSGATVDFPGLAAPGGIVISSGTESLTLPGTCGRATVYPPYGVGGCGGPESTSGSGNQPTGGGSADCKMIWSGVSSWAYSIGAGGTAGSGGGAAGNGGIFIVQDFTH